MAAPLSQSPVTLAVIDMGSNSFRLELGRVEGGQIYRLDTFREPLRLSAGLDQRGNLTITARREAVAALARFGERLRGLHPTAVRAVATSAFRQARNAALFLPQAERALGFPIDIISGHEEARLIYAGVSRLLPLDEDRRLVMDIGGGSTEFIIGRGYTPERLESLQIGCVAMTQRYFGDGKLSARAFDAAETNARTEIESIARDFTTAHWRLAYASSGTALALSEILHSNNLSSEGITPQGLQRLRDRMIAARHVDRLRLDGLKPTRAPVLAGGLAIMIAALKELDVEHIEPVGGALRLGVLHDLLGRTSHHDTRSETVDQLMRRYRVDMEHAQRVTEMAVALYRKITVHDDPNFAQRLEWAGLLHEIGISVSHSGFHRHGSYILEHADMPGFGAMEQRDIALLVLGCRGRLDKLPFDSVDRDMRSRILALRLAVILHHARRPIEPVRIKVTVDQKIAIAFPAAWLRRHPLSAHLLRKEAEEWNAVGIPLTLEA